MSEHTYFATRAGWWERHPSIGWVHWTSGCDDGEGTDRQRGVPSRIAVSVRALSPWTPGVRFTIWFSRWWGIWLPAAVFFAAAVYGLLLPTPLGLSLFTAFMLAAFALTRHLLAVAWRATCQPDDIVSTLVERGDPRFWPLLALMEAVRLNNGHVRPVVAFRAVAAVLAEADPTDLLADATPETVEATLATFADTFDAEAKTHG